MLWPLERLVEPVTDATIAAFLCVLGANLGSFLNVVVHRVPRGESVVRGGSRCPACGSPVRWRDNVPVFGWLLLGGRCRDCGTPISRRYPLVESAACLIGAIVAVELLSGGRTLPSGRFDGGRFGADVLLVHADWRLALVCLVHAAALFLLLVWTLVETDHVPVPWRWFLTAAVGLGSNACLVGGATVEPGWPALREAALGALAGAALGWTVSSPWLRQSFVIAGVVLGWQALLTAALLMPLAAGARIIVTRAAGGQPPPGPTCLDLLVAVGVQFLTWRWLALVWSPDGLVAGGMGSAFNAGQLLDAQRAQGSACLVVYACSTSRRQPLSRDEHHTDRSRAHSEAGGGTCRRGRTGSRG